MEHECLEKVVWLKVKVKVNVTLQQATKAQRGKVELYSFFNLGARWGWVVNATPKLLYTLGNRSATHCIKG